MNVFYKKKNEDRTCEHALVWRNIATEQLHLAITSLAPFSVPLLAVHLFCLCVCYLDENRCVVESFLTRQELSFALLLNWRRMVTFKNNN